jgi:hypothetical protein
MPIDYALLYHATDIHSRCCRQSVLGSRQPGARGCNYRVLGPRPPPGGRYRASLSFRLGSDTDD